MPRKKDEEPVSETSSNKETLFGVRATCSDCDWEDRGTLVINNQLKAISIFSEILQKCQSHHKDKKPGQRGISNHHKFVLEHERFADGEAIAIVASAAITVAYTLEEEVFDGTLNEWNKAFF